jgi:hypothetical protein
MAMCMAPTVTTIEAATVKDQPKVLLWHNYQIYQ